MFGSIDLFDHVDFSWQGQQKIMCPDSTGVVGCVCVCVGGGVGVDEGGGGGGGGGERERLGYILNLLELSSKEHAGETIF